MLPHRLAEVLETNSENSRRNVEFESLFNLLGGGLYKHMKEAETRFKLSFSSTHSRTCSQQAGKRCRVRETTSSQKPCHHLLNLHQLEFAVQMTCQACVDAVSKVLNETSGVELKEVKLDTGQVVVESTLPSEDVKSIIESTGRLAVLLGMGGSEESQWGAAVAAMDIGSGGPRGVVRMAQITKDKCIFEGTVDGLPPGRHALCVHETGDTSKGCTSCGDVLGAGLTEKAKGILSELDVGSDGRATFRFDNDDLKVWDLIGRSVIIHQGPRPSLDNRLVCGIIARSSGLFQNSKRLCTCDGISIWEERNRPIAGEGRSKFSQL